MTNGWEMFLAGFVDLVVGLDAHICPPTLVGPAVGPTITISVACHEIDEGAATILEADEKATEDVGAYFDDVDVFEVDSTIWMGWKERVAWDGATCTCWDEVGAAWVVWNETEVERVDEIATECATEGAAVGVAVSGFMGIVTDLAVLAADVIVLVVEADEGSGVGPWICGADGWAWKTIGDANIGSL